MRISTTTSSKLKLITFIILLVVTVAVNAVTVSLIVRHYTGDNAASMDTSSDKTGNKLPVLSENTEGSVFGKPEMIVLHGDGKALTLTHDNEAFEEILELNEHRTLFVKSFNKAAAFDEHSIDAYYMEFVYSTPHKLSLKGVGECEASSIIFTLTGVHHGKIKFTSGGETFTFDKLAVDPELIVKIVELLA